MEWTMFQKLGIEPIKDQSCHRESKHVFPDMLFFLEESPPPGKAFFYSLQNWGSHPQAHLFDVVCLFVLYIYTHIRKIHSK